MDTDLVVRPATPADTEAWCRLRTALWPECPDDHPEDIAKYLVSTTERSVCFIATVGDGSVVGFAEVGLRDYAEDCDTSPVGFLEGIFVDPDVRTSGVGRALVQAGEEWVRAQGCTEMASDRVLDNEPSGAFHEAIGFAETVRLVAYRKDLTEGGA